ncbi:hypothetical protein BRAO375_1930035 [Bradyrhizobium sp. ORS 375]|nr:hypothetical protein BRAO375_1930035 [Bradyrhizobium sp. ORS 375]
MRRPAVCGPPRKSVRKPDAMIDQYEVAMLNLDEREHPGAAHARDGWSAGIGHLRHRSGT